MPKEAHIRIQNALLGYRTKKNVTEIVSFSDIEFFEGDFVALVGLNGSGKSTFIKTVCGLQAPLRGDIFLQEKNIKDLALNEIAKKIAVVLTEKTGGFNLTAFDTVAAGQIPYTNAFHTLEEKHLAVIYAAIAKTGIAQHSHKPLHELSDGLFQKTMVARALAQQTAAILLDEPTAFLDYASKHSLFLLLQHLAEKEGKCVLISSHDLDLVLTYCKKVLLFSNNTVKLLAVAEAKQDQDFISMSGGYIS